METNADIKVETTSSSDLTHHRCLNCGTEVTNNFCSACGQRKSTHRYSLQHFLVHDLVHGVFHLDKGFFFTAKELFTRPGHSIREFVEGKRANHFNYFSFVLIVLFIEYTLISFSSVKTSDLYDDIATMSGYQKVVRQYYKIVMLAGIPLLALASYLIFRSSKQNYTEHLILNIYRISAVGMVNATYITLTIFYNNTKVLYTLLRVIPFIEIIYSSWFFYQYFSVFGYKKWVLTTMSILTSMVLVAINNSVMSDIVNQIGKHFFK